MTTVQEALEAVSDKLARYRKEHGGEYVGGVEYTDCQRLIDIIRAHIAEQDADTRRPAAGENEMSKFKVPLTITLKAGNVVVAETTDTPTLWGQVLKTLIESDRVLHEATPPDTTITSQEMQP